MITSYSHGNCDAKSRPRFTRELSVILWNNDSGRGLPNLIIKLCKARSSLRLLDTDRGHQKLCTMWPTCLCTCLHNVSHVSLYGRGLPTCALIKYAYDVCQLQSFTQQKHNLSGRRHTDIHPTFTPSAGYRSGVDQSSCGEKAVEVDSLIVISLAL